jgi:NADPH-dependent glutamate synthase beta subunit-like oxidoreductase/Pyruvate/2-oxoacid:ferredoxin oxidoreductase delta subunit
LIAPRTDLTRLIDVAAEPGTGPVRERRPLYVDLLPPCNHACPAGENIQAWLAATRAGRYHEAWLALVRDNPLPAVHGRVCYHPCETDCNRARLDSTVSIHAVERFLGDLAAREGWSLPIDAPPSGRRVLVVGAGPSGLSAAYHLARLGHTVEVRDAGPSPGGMLRFGIPAYRLPREVLARELGRIAAMGVRFVLDHRVQDLIAEQTSGRFDAAFVAIGATVGRHVDIPARDAARVLDAVSMLHGVSAGERPLLGRCVVVYGGGNTAMDAARTARRLGAEDTLIIYRRDRQHMPARAFEADEAVEEGVRIKWLTTIKQIAGADLTVEAMELDPDGRPRPTGRLEHLRADATVLALGQESDSAFLRRIPQLELAQDGTVKVGPSLMTGHPGIFAGGDVIAGERTVTVSVGHGKKAARHIDAYLRGAQFRPPARHPVVPFESLRLPIYSDAERREQATLAPARRTSGFEEIVAGLTDAQARYEAGRCLSCGNCFECDQCFAACPEQAIEKLGPGRRYRYLYERCTGCAVCYETCPCHAIEMIPEPTSS